MNPLALGFRSGLARLLLPRSSVVLVVAILISVAVAALGREPGEASANLALSSAVFGACLPLLAYLAAGTTLSGRAFAAAARVIARHGVSTRLTGLGFGLALALALATAAVVSSTMALLFAYPVSDGRLWSDLARTFPIAVIGGVAYAAWYSFASSFGANGGGRKWLLGLDWIFGASSGVLALPWPRGHLRNLLGGAPVVELSQPAAFGVLALGTAFAVLLVYLRTDD